MTLPTAADIAVMILVLHTLVLLAIPLVAAFFAVRGAVALNRKTRETMPLVQDYARQMSDGADRVSQRIAEPVLKTDATVSRWRASWHRATRPLRRSAPNE